MKSLLATAAIIEQDGKILLVQEGKEHIEGLWDLPGGSLDENETISEGLKREVKEETGLKISTKELVNIYFETSQTTGEPVTVFLIRAEKIGKTQKDMDFDNEILDQKYFTPQEANKKSLRKPNRKRMIKDFQNSNQIKPNKFDYSESFI